MTIGGDQMLSPRIPGHRSGPSRPPTLSAIVICQDEESRIGRCLSSLRFCDEIVVVDGKSRDKTVEEARRFTDRVIVRPYSGTNNQKEFARRKTGGDWVLNVDADEVIPAGLAEDILAAIRAGRHIGYRIPVRTRVGGRCLRRNGCFPGYQKRLFLRESGFWDDSIEPHDRVVLGGRWGRLKHAIEHESAGSLDELEAKALGYGRMAGRSLARRGRRIDPVSAAFRPLWRFFRSYILKGGFLEGRLGLRLALIHYMEGREKYAVLRGNDR